MESDPPQSRLAGIGPCFRSFRRSWNAFVFSTVALTTLVPNGVDANIIVAQANPSDGIGMSGGWFALLLLVLFLSALLSAAQTAVTAIGPWALEELKAQPRNAPYLGHLPILEARFSTGAMFLLLMLCYLMAKVGMALAGIVGAFALTLLALLVHLVLIEVFARSLALSRLIVAFRWTVPVAALITLPMHPFVALLRNMGGVRDNPEQPLDLSDMHLRLLPSLRGVEQVLDEEAFDMIDSVREFAETTADRIMTPRTEVEGISRRLSPEQVYDILRKTEYSRLVVYEESLDQVAGTLLAKEVLLQRPADPFTMLREPIFAAENTRLPELLRIIRQNRTHLVVITDEYDGMAGVVTLHDLFESIIGHIEDIDDEDELWIRQEADGTWLLNGRVETWEVNEEIGVSLDEDIARTIGGLVFHTLGRPAQVGDEVDIEGSVRVHVDATRDNRVEAIRLEVLTPKSETAGKVTAESDAEEVE